MSKTSKKSVTAHQQPDSKTSTADRETPAGGSVIGAESDTPRHGHRARGPNEEDFDLPFQRLGPYRVTGRIGSGGMGDVYRGRDDSLDRDVALKVLPPELARDEDFVLRFQAEATAVAKLAHVNVVPVYFIGEEDGYHFFAMRLIDGEPLSVRLKREGRLWLDQAVVLVEQCLAGLQAAHARDLIHRDIKPGNILLERENDRPVLVDFGLVRRIGQQTQMTATGMVMGTVDYMAPEQARGHKVDCRADIYALGVLFYQVLAGRLPFEAETPTAMIFQHAYEDPQPLTQWVPDLPKPIVQITARMMAKNPDERYATCEDVLVDIRAFREGRGLSPTPEPGDSRTGHRPGSKSGDFGYETGEPTAEGHVADDVELPPDLDELADDSPLRRARDFAATMFRRHAPEMVQRLQGTTMQVDGAVAHHERHRRRLAALLTEARDLAQDLAGQLEDNRQAAAAEADEAESSGDGQQEMTSAAGAECAANIEALERQLAEQQEHVDELEHQLGKTDATLARLKSQRDVLLARLMSAETRQKLETDRPRRRLPPWAAVLVAMAVLPAVGLIGLGLAIVVAWLRPGSSPLTIPVDTVAAPAIVGRVFTDQDNDLVLGPGETGLAGWTVELAARGRRQGTFPSPAPAPKGRFGSSIAVVGENLLVGDPEDDTDGENAGVAYLFDRASGEALFTLHNPSPERDDKFGWCVAAAGENLLITAIRDNTGKNNAGAVYLFHSQTGELLHTFLNPSPEYDDTFGRSLAGSVEFIAIGSPKDDAGAYNCGAVYVYDAATYELLHTFADPNRDAFAWHGSAVGIAGDKIIVGAYLDDTDAGDAGMAYIYDAGTGELLHGIHSAQPHRNGVFGESLTVIGDKFAVRRVKPAATGNKGFVDVFEVESGEWLYTLEDPKPDGGPKFGHALAAAGNNLLVGAYTDNLAYLFDAATGELLNTYEGPEDSVFGGAVAGWDDKVMIGAPKQLVDDVSAGVIHRFDARPEVRTAQSGRDGSFRFGDLPPGKYQLRAIPPSTSGQAANAGYEQTIEIQEEEQITVDLPVTADRD